MNNIEEAIEVIRDPSKRGRTSLFAEGRYCMLGALAKARGLELVDEASPEWNDIPEEYINIRYAPTEETSAISKVIKEQYPDFKVNKNSATTCYMFNDIAPHDDVIRVMEKAAVDFEQDS